MTGEQRVQDENIEKLLKHLKARVSKNVLLFAKSPKFDYESYHKIFSSLLSTIQIYLMMVSYLFSLLNGYEIMQ